MGIQIQHGHHLVHPSWEELQIPGRFWTTFQRCLYSLPRLSRLFLPYPPTLERLFPQLYLICKDSFLFLLFFANLKIPFIDRVFSCSECPLWLIFPFPLLIFYILKGPWLFPLGPFDMPKSCSVVRMISQEIPAVAFPPLTFFQWISFTSNQCAEPDCNLCCVINRPLTLSLSLPFSFSHTIKNQLAPMDEKTPAKQKWMMSRLSLCVLLYLVNVLVPFTWIVSSQDWVCQ